MLRTAKTKRPPNTSMLRAEEARTAAASLRRRAAVILAFLSVVSWSAAAFAATPSQPTLVTATTAASESKDASEAAKSEPVWKPKVPSLQDRGILRKRTYRTERIGSFGFHHLEFYCGDAKSTANQFAAALGMSIVGTTGQATGNDQCVSYGLTSGDVRLLLTAPYSRTMARFGRSESSDASTNANDFDAPHPLPRFSTDAAHEFVSKHGLAARAVGLLVKDAESAYEAAVANGARPVLEATYVPACRGQKGPGCTISEVELYGDVVLRFVSYEYDRDRDDSAPFLPHLAPVTGPLANRESYGIYKIDHAVGNVPNLMEALAYISKFTGFHEFAEFTPEDVGTVESGLNSVVLASDSEDVLLPLNEPTTGKRKSQIQTYLEQNEGAGLQHLALKSKDIFETVSKMRQNEGLLCGFELMTRPSEGYYRELPDRLGDQLTPEQYKRLEELGILADADDEGILLQLFTKPMGDRPTFFIEIIQRIGCRYISELTQEELERPGCGGFGQGNFRELFKSIEEHEKTLKV